MLVAAPLKPTTRNQVDVGAAGPYGHGNVFRCRGIPRPDAYVLDSLACSFCGSGHDRVHGRPGTKSVLGIGERISIGAFVLWVAGLAAVLWKRPAADGSPKV